MGLHAGSTWSWPWRSHALYCISLHTLGAFTRIVLRGGAHAGSVQTLPNPAACCAPKYNTIWMDVPEVRTETQYNLGGRSRSVHRNTVQFGWTLPEFAAKNNTLGAGVPGVFTETQYNLNGYPIPTHTYTHITSRVLKIVNNKKQLWKRSEEEFCRVHSRRQTFGGAAKARRHNERESRRGSQLGRHDRRFGVLI